MLKNYLLAATSVIAGTSILVTGIAAAQDLTWGVDGAGGSGTWDTSTLDWFDGTNNVAWPEQPGFASATFAGTAGTVTIYSAVEADQITFQTPGYVLNSPFLIASPNGLTITANADATINSLIFATPGAADGAVLTKDGAGTLTLSDFDFFTQVNINAGDIYVPSANVLSTVFNFSPGSGATLTLGGGNFPGLIINGLNGGSANSGVILADGTAGGFTLSINSQGGNYAGILSDNSTNTLSLEISNGATQILTAANTYSGTTTIYGGTLVLAGAGSALNSTFTVEEGGSLLLDNSTGNNPNRVSDTAPFTLFGTLIFKSGSSTPASETLGPLDLPGGQGTILLEVDPSQIATLTFASLPPRSTSNLGLLYVGGLNPGSGPGAGNVVFTTPPAMVNGLVPGVLAGVSPGTTFVTYGPNGLTPFADSVYATNSFTGGISTLVNLTGANALNANTAISALRLQSGASLSGSGTLQIASGSLLALPGSEQIALGTLDFGSVEGLIITQGNLVINSQITGSSMGFGLTKSGPGTLTLAAANTYRGATTVTDGILSLANNAALADSSGTTVENGATLLLSQSVAIGAEPLTLGGDGVNGFGTLRSSGGTPSWAGTVLGLYENSSTIPGGPDTSGTIDVEAGQLTLTGPLSGGFTKTGAGSLLLTGTNTSNLDIFGVESGTVISTILGDYMDSTVHYGPLGRMINLAGGITSLSPSGSGNAVTLSTGSNGTSFTGSITYSGSATLALNHGAYTSLTFATDTLTRSGAGTLVIAPSTGTLGAAENFVVAAAVPVVNGMAPASIILQTNDSERSGLFVTYGASGFAPVSYSSATDLNTSNNTTIFSANTPQTLVGPAGAYALANNGQTIDLGGNTLTLGSSASSQAGLVLNGGAIVNGILSDGTMNFSTGPEILVYTSSAGGTISSQVVGDGGFTKFGPGTLILSGNVTVNPGNIAFITVNGGTLDLRGNSAAGINLAADATLTGTGNISQFPSGGLIAPGESVPGILTAYGTNPANFAFRFTQLGLPNFSSPTASGNDVLHLTQSGSAFLSPLTAANIVNIYFDRPDGLNIGDVFDGGFVADGSTDFFSSIENATFQYYVSDPEGAVTWDGVAYDPYTLPVSVTTVPETADFGSGPVDGYIMQLTIPEPAPWHWLAFGLVYPWRLRRSSSRSGSKS